jgi:ABC-2 type transport system permease protein
MFGVLYAVFSQFFRFGSVRFYPVVLLTGVVIYEYFGEATGTAVPSVLNLENLVRKIHFPRLAIPLSVTLTAAFNLTLNYVVVFFFMLVSGVPARWSWLALFPLLGALFVFTTGLAMLLSALFVDFRDISPIWEVFLRALFYATPIIYPIEKLAAQSPTLAHIVMLNPLAVIIQEIRHLVIDASAPSAAEAIGGTALLLIPAGIVVVICVLGFWVFNRAAPHIAERL